ncbi:MAG TPA: MerR family transcriptional regulator [Stackebrandtia sp.]|nr:MerR family transcriptional regulator [Stackebrandtia sp.]HZE41740.1 MerR family transcriptional regulator [Stackebrandtia sp.]
MLTVKDVAATTGYSAQQIRDLEGLGVISPAARADNGYRRFDAGHVADLRAYRDLAFAVGPVDARGVMSAIRRLPLGEATELAGSLHTRLRRQRDRALAARRALEAIGAEARTDAEPEAADAMTITQLSQALGVRASTLRFWEREGLVEPEHARTRAGTARRYQVAAVRHARIVAALRAAGYRIPDVRQAIAAVRDLEDVGRSAEALGAHADAISRRWLALLRASARLAEIIAPGVPGSP